MTPYVFAGLEKEYKRLFLVQEPKNFKEKLLIVVCNVFNTDKYTVMSKSRIKNACDARHCAMYFLNKKMKIGPSQIGRFFGRDHATVIVAVEKCEGLIKYNKTFREKIKQVQDAIDK